MIKHYNFSDKSLDDQIRRICDKVIINSLTKKTDYQIDFIDSVILLDGSSATVDIKLPSASKERGRIYYFKAIDISNATTISCDGTDTINGSATYTFGIVKDGIIVVSDGVSNWELIGESNIVHLHASTHVSGQSDQVDHDTLLNFVANEHIDWTNATDDFDTSGNVQCTKVFPHLSNWRMEMYSDTSLAVGSGFEFYSANAGFNQGNFNFISNYAAGSSTGKMLFLATPNGSNYYTMGVLLQNGFWGMGYDSPVRVMHARLTDGRNTILTNQVNYIGRFGCYPSSGISNGFGVGIEYELKDSVGQAEIAATLNTIWTDSTSGSEDADFEIALMSGGSAASKRARFISTAGLELTAALNTDIPMSFNATSSNGLYTWMEDEDYFKFDDDIFLLDGENLIFDTTTGSKLGTATTQKIGFWNTTPIIQPATANQAALTNSTGGGYDGTLAAIGGTGDDTNLNNNFTDIHTLLDEIRTALVNSGIIKGAA